MKFRTFQVFFDVFAVESIISLGGWGLKMYYPLDLASAMPVLAILEATTRTQQPRVILDACAAPGGKFLVMAGVFLSSAADTKLVAMENDAFRLSRLKQNVRLYIPQEVSKSQLQVLGGDASKILGRLPDAPFDAILVDAPCSSERERLLRGMGRQREEPWQPEKADANARRQVALLRSALRNAMGTVVYATCALSRIENDAVVQEIWFRSVTPKKTPSLRSFHFTI